MQAEKTASSYPQAEALTPHDLIWMHINNPNHIVTDSDLQNLAIGIADEEKTSPKKLS